MARQNDQIYEAATNGFANEKPLRPLKQLNVLIEQKKQLIKEDRDDLDTIRELKDQIAVLDRQVNSIARLNVVKALLYRGSYDPRWTSSMFPRNTSLHSAAKFGHPEICSQLIRHGWDVNQTNDLGQTPLILASISARLSTAEVLLKYGSRLLTKDKSGHDAAGYLLKNLKTKGKKEKNSEKILERLRHFHEKRREAKRRFQEKDEQMREEMEEASRKLDVDKGQSSEEEWSKDELKPSDEYFENTDDEDDDEEDDDGLDGYYD